MMADAKNIVATMGLRADWPNLGVISLTHSYGFSNLVLPLLLHGIPLVLAGGALPELLRRAAAGLPAVTVAAVPALWQNWHDANAIPGNVRLAISAGAPLPLALEQSVFARHQIKIHNFYGSSECGGIAYDPALEPRKELGYAGTPLEGVQVSTSLDGCLEVRSGAVGETYWPEPSPALRDGVFLTSDLGVVIAGTVYLRGRAGDQINVAGRKVEPEVIEQVLATCPQVRGCLAFGVPTADAQRGDIIVACVAVASGVTNQSLKQFALDKLPAWQVPREWWLVDSLEVNGRGKLSRSAWRKHYLEERQNKLEAG
jgi:acyl-CoA synthetase (AMP-forming)/AMP-acid ligase II